MVATDDACDTVTLMVDAKAARYSIVAGVKHYVDSLVFQQSSVLLCNCCIQISNQLAFRSRFISHKCSFEMIRLAFMSC